MGITNTNQKRKNGCKVVRPLPKAIRGRGSRVVGASYTVSRAVDKANPRLFLHNEDKQMIETQTPVVKIGTVIPKLGTVLSIGKNQVKIQVNKQKQITCNFGEIERFVGV